MKKIVFIAIGLMLFATMGQCQIKRKWSDFLLFFGFDGGYYRTEVKIPIQQIRFQDTDGIVKIIDYTKAIDGIKYAEPYIGEGVNYSQVTDPQTSTIYISVRPLAKFMTFDENHIAQPFVFSRGAPFPKTIAYLAETKLTSNSTLLLNKTARRSTSYKIDSSVTHYTATTTKTVLATDTVGRIAVWGIGLMPITTVTKTKPTQTLARGIPTIPDVDPNSPAILSASDIEDGRYIIPSDSYLFVPDGNKMPTFSQLLIHQAFVSGPFSLLFKWRGAIPANGKLPRLDGVAASTGLSFGMVVGTKHGFTKLRRGNSFKNPTIIQWPLFMVGFNSTDVSLKADTNGDGQYESYKPKDTRVVFSEATGLGLQFQSISVMGLIGQDILLGADRLLWPYHRKIWYGLSFGVSLDKLVGISK